MNSDNSLPSLATFLSNIPFFTRCTLFSLVLCAFCSFFTTLPSDYLPSTLYLTIHRLQLWRLLTSCFYETGLFLTTLLIINFNTFLHKLEYRTSTTTLILKAISTNVVIQTLSLLIDYFLVSTLSLQQSISGAAGLWSYMLYKYCHYNSNRPIKLCCSDMKISKKVFPFLMVGIISILYMTVRIDVVVGTLLALGECTLCRRMLIIGKKAKQIGDTIFQTMKIKSVECWAEGEDSRIGANDEENYSGLEDNDYGGTSSTDRNVFKSKGVRIGDY